MAQFDLFRNPRSRVYPLLLDVQADLLRDLATHVVVPLTPLRRLRGKPLTRLNPIVPITGEDYAILFPELAALPVRAFGDFVASLQSRRSEIIAALDLLFTGI